MNWSEFFYMGGYAWYVWPSWGITILVMLALFVQSKLENAKIRRNIARQIAREQHSLQHNTTD